MSVSPKLVLQGGLPRLWPKTAPAPFSVNRGTLRDGLLTAARSRPGFLLVWDATVPFCWVTFRHLKKVMNSGAVAAAFPAQLPIPSLFDIRLFAVVPDPRYFPLEIPAGHQAHPAWFWRAIQYVPGFSCLPIPRVLQCLSQ